jgi:hypothetical protein
MSNLFMIACFKVYHAQEIITSRRPLTISRNTKNKTHKITRSIFINLKENAELYKNKKWKSFIHGA